MRDFISWERQKPRVCAYHFRLTTKALVLCNAALSELHHCVSVVVRKLVDERASAGTATRMPAGSYSKEESMAQQSLPSLLPPPLKLSKLPEQLTQGSVIAAANRTRLLWEVSSTRSPLDSLCASKGQPDRSWPTPLCFTICATAWISSSSLLESGRVSGVGSSL